MAYLVPEGGERSSGPRYVLYSLDCLHVIPGGCWCAVQPIQNQLDKTVPRYFSVMSWHLIAVAKLSPTSQIIFRGWFFVRQV